MNPSRRSILIGAGGVTLFGASGRVPAHAQSGPNGTLVAGAVNMRHLNPAIQPGNATGIPGTQIFAGLVLFDDHFAPQPYLAEAWDVSPDGLTYTFHLRNDAVFHDGKPVTAADVAFSIETVRDHHPLLSVTFKPILDTVETVDDTTVRLRLKKPYSALLNAFGPALTPILPKHVYGEGPIMTNPANLRPIGSGPFKFVEWKQSEYLILEKHDRYFRPGRPYFDRIVFKLVEDPTLKALMVERGDLDFTPFSFIRVNDVARLRKSPAVTVTTKGYEALGPINYLEMNLRSAPLDDVRVREALAHAMDKNFIVEKLHHGLSRRLDGPLHHGNPFFDQTALKIYDFDVARANELLDAAGHPRNADGTRFQLTLDIPTFNTDSSQLVAQYLKSQLRHVGIEIVLRPSSDLADWSSRIASWNYQLTMNATFNYPDPAIGVSRSFVCDNIKKIVWTNTEGYCNPKVDEDLREGAVARAPENRKAFYSKFQTAVTSDLPFVWTNEEPYTTMYKPKLSGIPLGVWGALSPWDELRWSA